MIAKRSKRTIKLGHFFPLKSDIIQSTKMLETREQQDLRRNWVAAFSCLPCGRHPVCSCVRHIFTSKRDSEAETAAMFSPLQADWICCCDGGLWC